MSIYECTAEGPYEGWQGIRVVVSVAGKVHQHYYSWAMYGTEALVVAKAKEKELLKLQKRFAKMRLRDLTPRRVKEGSPSYGIARNLQFVSYRCYGEWFIGFNINKVGGRKCVKVALNGKFNTVWKKVLETYVELNGITNAELAILKAYKPSKEALVTHVNTVMINHRNDDFPLEVFNKQLLDSFKK